MRKSVLAATAVIALAAAAAAALPVAQEYIAGRVKAEVERAGTVTVGSVEIGILDRRITLNAIRPVQATGLSAARWQASGITWPLGELLHGRTPLADFRLGAPLQAARVEVDKLSVTTPEGQSWSFGSVVLDGFDLARFDANVPPGPARIGVLGARLVGALSVRHFEERDVIYTLPRTGDTAGFRLLSGDGLDHGSLAAFSLASFEATAKAAVEPSFKLGELKGEKLDMRQVVATMGRPSWRPGRPLGRLHLDRASATGFGGTVLERYGISLGSITTETVRESADVSRSTTHVEDFVLVPPARGLEGLQMRIAMQAMGLKELKLDLKCAGSEDRTKGELSIDRCTLGGEGLGELDLAGKLVQVDPIFWHAIDSGDMTGIDRTRAGLGAATLVLVDKGLVERSIRALSATTGQPPAVTRANVAAEIRGYQPPHVLITEEMTKFLDTIARFIEQGGTLTVEARPDPPFGLDRARYLNQPGADLMNLLGLSASLAR